MKIQKTPENAAFEELLEKEFPTKGGRAQFEREVALKVSIARRGELKRPLS